METLKDLCIQILENGYVEPLLCAIEDRNSCLYKTSLSERNAVEDELGNSLLHILLKNWGNTKQLDDDMLCASIDKMLKLGVDIEKKDETRGYSALHYCILKELDPKVMTFLLAKGKSWENTALAAGKDGKNYIDLLSDVLCKKHKIAQRDQHGGSVVTFGKSDFQLGYTTEQTIQAVPKRVKFMKYNGNDLTFVSAARFHSVALSKDGRVYSWGQGNGGKLGHGDETTYILPTMISSLQNHVIVKVAVGRDHTLALSSSGDVFTWGCDRYGQLGLGLASQSDGDNSQVDYEKVGVRIITRPRRVKLNGNGMDIGASATHSLCVLSNGKLYSWGLNDRGQLGYRSTTSGADKIKRSIPNCLDSFDHKDSGGVIRCAAADGVSCIVTSSGRVWQWGRGSPNPTRVLMKSRNNSEEEDTGWHKARESVKIVQVATGPNHSCAISENGALYTWGTSAELLGHSYKGCDRTLGAHTTVGLRVEMLWRNKCKVMTASCSKRHTCAVDESGQLWVWGYGDHGILGIGQTYQPSPRRVPYLRRVSSCCAADSHTIALVSAYKPPLMSDFETCVESCETTEEVAFHFEEDNLSEASGEKLHGLDLEKCYEVESLARIVEKIIASTVNIWNVMSIWNFARMIHQKRLEDYCYNFVRCNMDGVIVANPGCGDVLAEFFDCVQNSLISTPRSSHSGGRKSPIQEMSTSPQIEYKSLTRDYARKRLKELKKKLRYYEDIELRLNAVKSKGKKSDGFEISSIRNELRKLKKFLEIEKSNGDSLVQDDELYCNLCNVRVPDRLTMVDHVAGRKHRKMMVRNAQFQKEGRESNEEGIPIPSRPSGVRSKTDVSSGQKEHGSSLESISSWGTPFSTPVKQVARDLREIMLEEESAKAKRKTSITPIRSVSSEYPALSLSSLISSPDPANIGMKYAEMCSYDSASSLTSPIAKNNCYDLSSFVKKEQNRRNAWGSLQEGDETKLVRTPVSLHSIQSQQETEISRSLSKSSWGYCEKNIISVATIQQEQYFESQLELLKKEQLEQENRFKQKTLSRKGKSSKKRRSGRNSNSFSFERKKVVDQKHKQKPKAKQKGSFYTPEKTKKSQRSTS